MKIIYPYNIIGLENMPPMLTKFMIISKPCCHTPIFVHLFTYSLDVFLITMYCESVSNEFGGIYN